MTTLDPLPIQATAASSGHPSRREAAGVFLLALAIYCAFFGGHYVMGDHTDRIAWAKSLIDHHFGSGSTNISAYVSDAVYCKYGIGQSLLHVPFLLLAGAIKRVTHLSCEGPVNMLPYVLNGATGILLIHLILRRLEIPPRTAACRALIVGLASVWFPYTKLEYGESLVATALLAVWYFGLRRPLAAGIIAGIAMTIRSDALVWGIITLLGLPATDAMRAREIEVTSSGFRRLIVLRRAAWFWFFAGLAPAMVLVALANFWRTGSPLTAGYERGFIYPWFFGMEGLLFSPGKSLFLFSPLLILLFPALFAAIHRHGLPAERSSVHRERRALAIWAAVLLGAQVLFYARWWDWPGDDSWGPRFLAPGTMAALLLVASTDLPAAFFSPAVRRAWAWSSWILALAGLAVALPAVLMGPHTSVILTHERKPMKVEFASNDRSLITLNDERFLPRYSQVVSTWELVRLHFTGRIPHSAYPQYTGSTWAESFAPPLRREDAPLDLFWLHPLRNRRAPQPPQSSSIASSTTTSPASRAISDEKSENKDLQDQSHARQP